jgi:hypothetical protein
MKTTSQVRTAFWQSFPEFKNEYRKTWRQNQYNATIRTSFVDYVDNLRKRGEITESLANRVTL